MDCRNVVLSLSETCRSQFLRHRRLPYWCYIRGCPNTGMCLYWGYRSANAREKNGRRTHASSEDSSREPLAIV